MDKKRIDFISVAKQTVESIYKGKPLRFHTNESACILPDSYKNDDTGRMTRCPALPPGGGCDIEHRGYKLVASASNVGVVTGSYFTVKLEKSGRRRTDLFLITLAMSVSPVGVSISHLHISRGSEERFYLLDDISERRFRVHESEILYLEAGHNHILWHCERIRIETMGSFKKVEGTLSEEFIRIHRSFIVNRRHACVIARCYVELDNGERLQIPVKKYCEVKRRLLERCVPQWDAAAGGDMAQTDSKEESV